MPVTDRGKVCYLQIPCADPAEAARFYASVFGWRIRSHSDGHLAFDDATGDVSGAWVTGRPPSATPGLLVHVRVPDVEATCRAVVHAGGAVVAAIGVDPGEVTAHVADPYGNVLALYQEPNPEAVDDDHRRLSGLAAWLTVNDAAAAAAFYRRAFGVETLEEASFDGVVQVARLRLGVAEWWVQREDDAGSRPSSPARFLLYLDDPDTTFARAVEAGCQVMAELHDEHGWRTGRLRDPFGYEWETAQTLPAEAD